MSQKKLNQSNQSRPPIIAILGHVDHGKTTLLDALKSSHLVLKENGGITQHIGAYQINYQGKKITFIDTPGHAAFKKMRSRGVSVADLVILVIAANDGVKPQTKEAIDFIKQTKTPFLVAINKIDLPQASVEMVKAQLAKNDVLVEGYGGDIVCVEISAKQKKGLDNLLEMTLLLSEMQNLLANFKGELEGVIIDSKLNSQKGPLATVLVKNGSLMIGDELIAQNIPGKVKLMVDENGKKIKKAGPSKPIEVLGFKQAPPVGAKVTLFQKDKFFNNKKKTLKKTNFSKNEEKQDNDSKIRIILKADSLGMLEAIKNNLAEEVLIIFQGVGQINESDILLARSTKAQIIAFNVKSSAEVKKLAQTEKIKIKTYNIIYKLLEDIEKKVLKILEPTIDEEILGEAEIIAEFKIKKNHIAGCRVIKGEISKKNLLHWQREGKIIKEIKITSFQKERQEIQKAKKGEEIGLVFKPDIDFKIGDVIISYKK